MDYQNKMTFKQNSYGQNYTFKENKNRRRSPKNHKKQSGFMVTIEFLGTYIFFPLMLIYLEIVFHIYMGLNLKYMPVYILFSIPLGLFFSLFASHFPKKINRIITYILTFIICLLFCIELICRVVLQSYYPLFSVMKTAAGNHLTDYAGAVITGILGNIIGLLLFLLPFLFIMILGRRIFRFQKKPLVTSLVVVIIGIVIHLLGILSLHLPWSGDITPSVLYKSNLQTEDQVEQLGIMTMLRLDAKYTIFGNSSTIDNEIVTMPILPQSESESGTAETEAPEATTAEQVVDTSPNVMDIDFDALDQVTSDDNVLWLNSYFQSVTATNKNEYTGMFEGYNVIFITAEAFSKWAVSEELTPTLYKLINEGFVFNNYYTPLHYTSTSNGECQLLLGIYPQNGGDITMQKTGEVNTNTYFSLARQLNRIGYDSIGFHNNVNMYGRQASHDNLGYEFIQAETGFDLEMDASGTSKIWPQSDLYMMENTVDSFINSENPFNVYYLTVSGHLEYNFEGNQMAMRNQDVVAELPYSEKTKAYLACNYELEKAMTYLLQRLEEAGKLDSTLIVLSGDHIPYSDTEILEELSGQSYGGEGLSNIDESGLNFDIYQNALIMWSGSIEKPLQVDKICTMVDVLPTISNLLGLEYDSRLLIGTDILSDSSSLVIFKSRCWLTEYGFYNRYDETFTPAEGVTLSDEDIEAYVTAMKKIVANKLDASVAIIDTDYYNIVFPGT